MYYSILYIYIVRHYVYYKNIYNINKINDVKYMLYYMDKIT